MKRWLRLRQRNDFGRLRAEGRAFHHPAMILSFRENGLNHNRYGFIVSGRVGNAVQRNRVRRRLREAVWRLHPQLQQQNDIVIIARPSAAGQPFHNVRRIVYGLCKQAGLLV